MQMIRSESTRKSQLSITWNICCNNAPSPPGVRRPVGKELVFIGISFNTLVGKGGSIGETSVVLGGDTVDATGESPRRSWCRGSPGVLAPGDVGSASMAMEDLIEEISIGEGGDNWVWRCRVISAVGLKG